MRVLEATQRQGVRLPRFPHKNLELYFAALEDERRHKEGREPLRKPPYTEEDYHEDMRAIAELRGDPGWQSREGRAFLDEWEDASRESLEKGMQL